MRLYAIKVSYSNYFDGQRTMHFPSSALLAITKDSTCKLGQGITQSVIAGGIPVIFPPSRIMRY